MKKLIREFIMDCPICGKSHTVQEYEDETNVEIKNDEVKQMCIRDRHCGFRMQ